MNNETILKSETNEGRTHAHQPRQGRKPWVTPIVSASPVNEVTAASLASGVPDGLIYS
jgi:hypothetical protein